MWVTGNYNVHTLDLAGFTAQVMWESSETGFKVRFESFILKRRFRSLDEAKTAAEKLATVKAEELLAAVVALKK